MILFDAITRVNAAGNIEFGANEDCYANLISALKATSLDCVTGHITFDANNNPIKECVIIGIQDGAYKFETKI